MNRFYIERSELNNREGIAHIRGVAAVTHISKALRLREGDEVEICAGLDDNYIAVIEQISKSDVRVAIKTAIENRELTLDIDLFQGIPKGHKWDFLIQKAVEAGVSDIYPVQMNRSVSIIKPAAAKKKQQRWQKIADQAAMQSKRSYLTQIKTPIDIKTGIALMANYDLVLIAYEEEKQSYLKRYESAIRSASKIAIWIGPEGGLDPAEAAKLSEVGNIISLGKRIYRTESAAMALLAQIGYIVEQ